MNSLVCRSVLYLVIMLHWILRGFTLIGQFWLTALIGQFWLTALIGQFWLTGCKKNKLLAWKGTMLAFFFLLSVQFDNIYYRFLQVKTVALYSLVSLLFVGRFSPYYRSKEGLTITSASFSHKLNPNRVLCRYDMQGTCNDQHCTW